MLAAWHWDDVEKHTGALLSFGRAVLPLLLPIVVVGIAGAVAFPFYLQIPLVLALALFAWRAIILPERRAALEALRSPISSRIDVPFGAVAVPLLIAVVAFFVLIRPGDGPFEDRGGLILLYAAIPFWIGAALLRALGYSTSLIRLAIGVCLVAFVLLSAALAGIVPGGDALNDHLPWLTPALALAAIAALLVAATLGLSGRRVVPERWTGSLQALGLVSAIFAAVILAGAAIDGAISARAHTNQRIDPGREAGEPLPAQQAPAILNGRQLAERYVPVLVLAKGEQWHPIPIDGFVRDATLVNRAGRRTPHPAQLPDHCPGPDSAACFRLELDNQGRCDTGDDPCAQSAPVHRGQRGTTYFRVLRKATKHGSYAFSDRYSEPAASRAAILIQYWFFYRYNEWKRPILSGTLAQRHQGDWEAVTVGLSDAATPLFIAYSEHCGGTWRNWSQIETAPGSERTHPLVAVAKGSHANYVDTDERRSPDWASCGGGVPQRFLSLLSYASNIRDETSFGAEITRFRMRLIRAAGDEAPMSFPGTWGADDRTTLENERIHVLKEGAAPATPSYQRLWQDPLATIFCGAHWDPPEGDSAGSCTR